MNNKSLILIINDWKRRIRLLLSFGEEKFIFLEFKTFREVGISFDDNDMYVEEINNNIVMEVLEKIGEIFE